MKDKILYHGIALMIALLFSIPFAIVIWWFGLSIFIGMIIIWTLINSENPLED